MGVRCTESSLARVGVEISASFDVGYRAKTMGDCGYVPRTAATNRNNWSRSVIGL